MNESGSTKRKAVQLQIGQALMHNLFETLLQLYRLEAEQSDMAIPATGAPMHSAFTEMARHTLSTYDPAMIRQIICGILSLASTICRSMATEEATGDAEKP